MEAFERLMGFFMSPQCFEEIFYKFNFFNVVCLKMIISKGLGYGILAGSVMLRVPQILKIVSARSGAGISMVSEILTLLALFGTMAYGYFKQFSMAAYGDVYFLYIQAIIIIFLILYYQNRLLNAIASLVIVGAMTSLLFLNLLDAQLINTLNGVSLFLSMASKLIQAFSNYQNGSTGNLSAITLILQFAGGAARIFTSIQETGDIQMIVTFISVSVANFILVLQLLYYWNVPAVQQAKEKKKN
jgi:mannose-P-dolichol utilization defect protein 1